MTACTLSIVVLLAVGSGQIRAQSMTHTDSGARRRPTLQAVRIRDPIVLDGKLDDPDWALAAPATNFTQRFPVPGRAAMMRTEVRILYDDDAIYVGARMYDPHPDSITAPLARRDPGDVNSDWIDVLIDSYRDHRTAFRFAVNPRGTKLDVYHFNDTDDDASWDGIWDAATRIDSLGWTAEMRIPLSQLRFHASDVAQTWGLNFYRAVARHDEWTFWAPTPPTAAGFVSEFGELTGLEGLHPRRAFEARPYVSTRAESGTRSPGDPLHANQIGANVGSDFQAPLGPAMTLTATINPDFGQVDFDPAVLNLTANEVFFAEKRPFFLEGAGIFASSVLPGFRTTGDTRFVHWRRIGRAPQLTPNALWVDAPNNTAIAGAAKLAGQLGGGWSIGALEALTRRADARVANADGMSRVVGVEPAANYAVVRVKRDMESGRSSLGFLATAMNRANDDWSRALRSSGYVYGIDGRHASADRRWTAGGFVNGSDVRGSPESIASTQESSVHYFQRPDASYVRLDTARTQLAGYDAGVGLAYQGTPSFGSLQLRSTSPGFEPNDLGFSSRSDIRSIVGAVGISHQSDGMIRDGRLSGHSIQAWNFGGARITNEFGLDAYSELKSYSYVQATVRHLASVTDDRLTRGGPSVPAPAEWRTSLGATSDMRRPWIASADASLTTQGAHGHSASLSGSLILRPTSSLQLSVAPSLTTTHAAEQYVNTVSDGTASATFGQRYVFAALAQQTLAMALRADWTLTNALSLQAFAQPFTSAAKFGDYKELSRPGVLAFDTYGAGRGTVTRMGVDTVVVDPDGPGPAQPFDLTAANQQASFLSRAIRANVVLRWEFETGSTLYLLWQQTRDAQVSGTGGPLARELHAALGGPVRNVLDLKVSYRIGH